MPAKILGYGGASLAAFLSIAGALDVGSTIIQALQANFWGVLEQYQDGYYDNDTWGIINDDDLGQQFANFITVYGVDTLLLTVAVFWHIQFLIGLGLSAAFLLFSKVNTYSTDYPINGGTDIPIDKGFQLFAFGALFGAVDYLAALAMKYNQTTIMNMLSFYDKSKESNVVKKTETIDPSGMSTFEEKVTKMVYWKKDLFDLFELQDTWTNLFWSQRLLQMIQPYVFIAMIESAVGIVFGLMFYFAYL